METSREARFWFRVSSFSLRNVRWRAMRRVDAVWVPGAPVEITPLWPDHVLRLDEFDICRDPDGDRVSDVFVRFTILPSERPGEPILRGVEVAMHEWSEWYARAGLGWTFWDSVGSTFDDRVFDIRTLPDREAIGGEIEVAAFMPQGVESGFEPSPWMRPPRDLAWIDVGFVADPSRANRSWTCAPPTEDDLDEWFVIRVENPLAWEPHAHDWPFRHGVQGFQAHRAKRWSRLRELGLR